MKLRWLGVTGTTLLLASLVLMVVSPRLWPTAFFGARAGSVTGGMMSGSMMGSQDSMTSGGMMGGQNGMMSDGMMDGSGGMVAGGMMGMMMAEDGMMSGEVGGDASQPFDLRFLDQMVPHHQMAVHSAQMTLANSERSGLRDLAQRIITAQQAEIEQMSQWRTAWFPDAPAAPALMMMGGQDGMMGGGMMGGQGGMMNGGMMSDQEQLDRLFLEMMIPHHEAAISMARQALEESERPEIRSLAEAIISSQSVEIEEMRGYLRDFFGATTP